MAKGIVRNIPPRRNPAHLTTVFDVLEQAAAAGRDAARPGAARAGRDDPPAGALIVIISDLFVEPELLRGCFQHLRFRKHDVAVFHLLDPLELGFDFRRPMRFLDMEGGPVDLRRAERDRRSLSQGARRLSRRRCGRSCSNRPSTIIASRIDEDYEQVLMRFLVGRTQAEGGAMSFLQPMLLAALPLVALPIIIHLINQRRYQTIRWAAMMFLLAANRMSRGYARLRQWLIMAFRMAGHRRR